MKKIILTLLLTIGYTQAWEVNTHRAIDQTAIKDTSAENLKKFIDASGIAGEDYAGEIFEGYGMTYFEFREFRGQELNPK